MMPTLPRFSNLPCIVHSNGKPKLIKGSALNAYRGQAGD
jgi:hypothetical protein